MWKSLRLNTEKKKILAIQIQLYIKRTIHHDKVGFISGVQGFFHKPISVIYHINRLKNKHHTMISIDAEKAFDRIPYSFVIQTLQKVVTKKIYLDII